MATKMPMIRKRTTSWTTISTNRWNLPTRLILLNKSLEASTLKNVYNTSGQHQLEVSTWTQKVLNKFPEIISIIVWKCAWNGLYVARAWNARTLRMSSMQAAWHACLGSRTNNVYWKLLSFRPKVGNLHLWGRSSSRRIKHTYLGVMNWPADASSTKLHAKGFVLFFFFSLLAWR